MKEAIIVMKIYLNNKEVFKEVFEKNYPLICFYVRKIEEYLLANPYPSSASQNEQIKAINEQYWVSTFLNGWESYANWRRTGIPELQPVDYQNNASNGEIPRRLTYPRTEYGTNGNHLQEAINEQGADTYSTRVWWDTEE